MGGTGNAQTHYYTSAINARVVALLFNVQAHRPTLQPRHQPQREEELDFVDRRQHVNVVLWVQLHRINDCFGAENFNAYEKAQNSI